MRRRQAHSSMESVCGPSLAVDRRSRPKAAASASRGDRQLASEGVVDLLAPLAEAGLHQPVERLARSADRDRGVAADARRRRMAESTSGGGSKAAAGTRPTTSASATFCAKTDR